MSRQKYVVQLADDERERLQKLVRGGVSPAREVVRARILLKADAGWTVVRIADLVSVPYPYRLAYRLSTPIVKAGAEQVLAAIRWRHRLRTGGYTI